MIFFLLSAIVCFAAGSVWSAEPASSPAQAESSLTFVVTADNHSGYNDSQKAVWQAIAPHRGAFAMTAGDVGSAGGIRRVIDECLGEKYPWYAAVGNHDLRTDRMAAFRALNPGGNSLPKIVNPGPPNCEETTYSFRYQNFFCGHHHVFRVHRMDKNDVWQVLSAWGRGCDPPHASDRWKHVKCTFVKVTVNGSTVRYEAYRGPKYGGPCDVPFTVEYSGTLTGAQERSP